MWAIRDWLVLNFKEVPRESNRNYIVNFNDCVTYLSLLLSVSRQEQRESIKYCSFSDEVDNAVSSAWNNWIFLEASTFGLDNEVNKSMMKMAKIMYIKAKNTKKIQIQIHPYFTSFLQIKTNIYKSMIMISSIE